MLGASDKFNILEYFKNIDSDFSKKIHSCNINDVNLFVRRSFSEDLWLWINDSARFVWQNFYL